MTVPLTPPEARIPLPASRMPSPSGSSSRDRLHVSDLTSRRSRLRSPLRSTSLPIPADGSQEQDGQEKSTRGASHLRLDTSASSPARVASRADHQMIRPFIVRSSTSTSTIYREGSTSVPPPMSSRRLDYEEMVRQEQAREENEAQDDFYKERGDSLLVDLERSVRLTPVCGSGEIQSARRIALDQSILSGSVFGLVSSRNRFYNARI